MGNIDLHADCSRCAALCCVLLPFDKSTAFGFSKPAGVPCRNLAPDNLCTIHASLPQGFPGCIQFDCHGAGQRVVQQVFGGKSWRDDPLLMPRMEKAFRVMRKLHEAVLLLQEAARFPLTSVHEQQRQELLTALDAAKPRGEADLAAFEDAAILKEIRTFLTKLRDTPAIRQRHR
ncbi:MAG: hypothetical protein ABIV25_06685 [Paracoccaceae bacterium]